MDFGNWVSGNSLGLWMRFKNASGADQNINTIRTVFAVVRGSSFLLTHSGTYHFHRNRNNLGGVTVGFWDASYTHANIRNGKTYLNGVQVTAVTTPWPADWSLISVVTTGNVEANRLCNDRTYRSGGNKYGEILIYDRELSDTERAAVEAYLTEKWFTPSDKPQPANGAVDVRRTATLSWQAGSGAVAHDVYFGTSLDDVSGASQADPKGVLVSPGQAETTYDPSIRFEIDRKYYWRVDEIGAAPGNAVYKGVVWSFTAETYSVALPNVTATASSWSGQNMTPAKTVTDPVKGQVLSLDGIGDAMDVPLLGTSSAITISMWVNSSIDTASVDFASFFHSDGWEVGDVHWRFRYARVDGGLNGRPNLSGRSIVKPNVWYHVAATVTPTEWALWLDGMRDGVAAIPTPIKVTLGDGLIGAWLGTDGVTISRNFTGMIDDVRFYNRTLSPEELAWLAGRTEPFAKPFN